MFDGQGRIILHRVWAGSFCSSKVPAVLYHYHFLHGGGAMSRSVHDDGPMAAPVAAANVINHFGSRGEGRLGRLGRLEKALGERFG